MAAVRITSRKVESRNGRARRDFAGELHSSAFGIVFSSDALILNLTDGARSWSITLDEETTAMLGHRFANRAQSKAEAA